MTEAESAPSPWRRRGRRAGLWLARIGLALVGALVAVLLFARISAPIGPFDATLAVRPGSGGAEVAVPPLGSLAVDVFDGPLRLDVQLQSVDQVRAQELANDPVRLAGVVDRVTADLQGAVVKLLVITVVVALLGAALVSWLVLRRRREPLIAAGLTGALLLGIGGVGATTWRAGGDVRPDLHRAAGQREQPDRQRAGHRGPLRRLPRLARGPRRQRRLAVQHAVVPAAARRGRRDRRPAARLRPAPQPRRLRPRGAGRQPVPGRRRPRHR
ncbi:hypothetical protein [Blastococcus sp. TML/C7B]|uniref:hypothetical protein n=1 Tax=Blastococcus sp. TML/C7B TaxID=2798728 RepID=UPI002814CA1E|nr:hypothetical protein [Blastococcus sp. TML/C7B]